MADRGKDIAVRKPRADAERNRRRLLDTAKAVFAEKGSAASLDEIARAAGVGIGTLYRHFPTRDALIEAVYRNEIDQFAAAATRLAETREPTEALREWMLLFIDYMVTKRGMAGALASLVGGTSELYASSGPRISESITMLVERAVASGEIRFEGDPLDLLRAVAGVGSNGAAADWTRAAAGMVDILIAGMRTQSGETPSDAGPPASSRGGCPDGATDRR